MMEQPPRPLPRAVFQVHKGPSPLLVSTLLVAPSSLTVKVGDLPAAHLDLRQKVLAQALSSAFLLTPVTLFEPQDKFLIPYHP